MPWTPLSTRFGTNIPLVLAGPILRKVTPTSVTVWLALRAPATITLSVFSSDATGTAALFASSPTSCIQLGANLHLIAITAHANGKPPLQPGQRYFYDIAFGTGSQSIPLVVATGNDASVYAYPTLRLPTFELPPTDINQVRLMMGSCRKPNALPPDALVIVDQEIGTAIVNGTARPHQLILGGDQIYADEVADLLLLMLSDAATHLVGQELMPTPHPTPGSIVAEQARPTTRSPLVKQAGFTSDDTRSHLLSFGEYLSMYLFVWSDVLWPKPADFPLLGDLTALGVPTADFSLELLEDIDEQRENVMSFATTVKQVRRALANIPTYMILDDHEITDDFNMSRAFCDGVYGDPLGMRVMRNGLAAYALCQHWGNAPEQFETSASAPFNAPAGVAFLQAFATAASNPTGFDTTLKSVLGLHTPAQMAARTPYAVFHDSGVRVKNTAGEWLDDKSLLFHYTIESPAYQVIVTDSRTWRSFPIPGAHSPPDLIAASQFAVQIGATPGLAGRQLMVVFTTNFPPCPGIRQAGRDVPSLPVLRNTAANEDFNDSWDVPHADYARALAELARKFPVDANKIRSGSVVVLSGDVHSASASRIHYCASQQFEDDPNAPTMADVVIAQMIASAINNGNAVNRGQHTEGYEHVGADLSKRLFKQPINLSEDFIGWNSKVVANDTMVGTQVSMNALTSPPAISSDPLRYSANTPMVTQRVEELPGIWQGSLESVAVPPHFRVRLDYLKAASGSHDSYTPPAIDKTNPLLGARDSALATMSYAVNVKEGQYIVGRNNIGEVGFTVNQAATPKAKGHLTIRWPNGPRNDFVRFDVPLDATNDIAKYPGEK
ncbi:MAG: hypothetical protein ABI664_13530 [bacterium]